MRAQAVSRLKKELFFVLLITFCKENFDFINLLIGVLGVMLAIIALVVEVRKRKKKKSKK